MKIINVKKLIISTLIFLFSSFHVPALADEAVPTTLLPVVQESVVIKTAPLVNVTQPSIITLKSHADLKNFCVQMASPQITGMEALGSLLFMGILPQLVIGPYKDERDRYASGYVLCDNKCQTKLEKALVTVLVHPEQFGVKPELVATDIFPKIFTAPGYVGKLIAVPEWKNPPATLMNLYLECTLLSYYSAFQGFKQIKGTLVHTKMLSSFAEMTLQCIAASLIPKLELYVHVDDASAIEPLQQFYAKNQGKPILEVLKSPLLAKK